MRNRGLIIAWTLLVLALLAAFVYAEATFNAGRPVASAPVGDKATGEGIKPDAEAVGAEEGAALVGAPAVGGGPPGRVVEQIDISGATPPVESALPEAPAPRQPPQPNAQMAKPAAAEKTPDVAPPPRIANAAPAPPELGLPRIVVIVSEIGLGSARSRQAIERLPPTISLAVMSFAADRDEWIDAARASGHEALIAVPMEPVNYPRIDPGPAPLLIDRDDLENLARFESALRNAGPVVGVLAHMGDRFLADSARLRPILAATQDRGMIFVDNRASPDSAVKAIATELGVYIVENDRFIDADPSADQIDRRLAELEDIARRRGMAVGLAAPYPIAIERIRGWAEGLPARGIQLAPASSLAAPPEG